MKSLVMFIFWLGTAAAAQTTQSSLAGKWYYDVLATQTGYVRYYDLKVDGTFRYFWQIGTNRPQTASGRWQLKGDHLLLKHLKGDDAGTTFDGLLKGQRFELNKFAVYIRSSSPPPMLPDDLDQKHRQQKLTIKPGTTRDDLATILRLGPAVGDGYQISYRQADDKFVVMALRSRPAAAAKAARNRARKLLLRAKGMRNSDIVDELPG